MYKRGLILRFPAEVVDQPIVWRLVKDFDLSFNILKATILPGKEGIMVMELSGHPKKVSQGLQYLRDLGVEVKPIGQEIHRKDEVCIHCGSCTAVCPTGALSVNRETMEVIFDPDRCSACGLCVTACVVRAMEVQLEREAL